MWWGYLHKTHQIHLHARTFRTAFSLQSFVTEKHVQKDPRAMPSVPSSKPFQTQSTLSCTYTYLHCYTKKTLSFSYNAAFHGIWWNLLKIKHLFITFHPNMIIRPPRACDLRTINLSVKVIVESWCLRRFHTQIHVHAHFVNKTHCHVVLTTCVKLCSSQRKQCATCM